MSNAIAITEKYIQQGLVEHAAFNKDFTSAKRHALNAGFYFLSAQQTSADFEAVIERHNDKIARRSVYRYMEFAKEALEWAAAEHAKFAKDTGKLLVFAQDMVMKSPKGYISLCRELGHMRKFGQYDEVKYRERKLGAGQIEFDFAKLTPVLDQLARFGDENVTFNYPEGVDTVEYIAEVETKLEAALKRVREIKKHGRAIEA